MQALEVLSTNSRAIVLQHKAGLSAILLRGCVCAGKSKKVFLNIFDVDFLLTYLINTI
jgi:hypothetical protein